ncbi:MAG TPA: hypothetical protein VGO58_02405, partial [Chitinophagaceae bacterium]|nr:hypothetical protein [Chitinophagaceae bacterium]
NGNLSLQKLSVDGSNINAGHLISSDTAGSSAHYTVVVRNCSITKLGIDTRCKAIFYAYKSIIADSIIFSGNLFSHSSADGIMMADEKDDKGYYNAEKISVTNNSFDGQLGTLLNIYRGGNDESTLGPQLIFANNQVRDCHTGVGTLMTFTGVQVTNIINNQFFNCNPGATLVTYKDTVRARHLFERNTLSNAGSVTGNAFLIEKNNIIK